MLVLVAERRYLLCGEPSPGTSKAHEFATAEYTHEFEGRYFFHRIAFHELKRDVPTIIA